MKTQSISQRLKTLLIQIEHSLHAVREHHTIDVSSGFGYDSFFLYNQKEENGFYESFQVRFTLIDENRKPLEIEDQTVVFCHYKTHKLSNERILLASSNPMEVTQAKESLKMFKKLLQAYEPTEVAFNSSFVNVQAHVDNQSIETFENEIKDDIVIIESIKEKLYSAVSKLNTARSNLSEAISNSVEKKELDKAEQLLKEARSKYVNKVASLENEHKVKELREAHNAISKEWKEKSDLFTTKSRKLTTTLKLPFNALEKIKETTSLDTDALRIK